MRFTSNNHVRRTATVLVATVLLTILPGAAMAADPPPTLTFDGSGWGHGVGMSQYGAYGRALDGQGYEEILEAYYTGATVGSLGQAGVPDPGEIVANVGSDMTSTVLTVFDGPGTPRTGMIATRDTGEATPPTVTLQTGDSIRVTDTTPLPGNPGGCEMKVTINSVETVWGESDTCDLTVELTPVAEQPTNVVTATNCRRPTQCTYGYGTNLRLVDNGSEQRIVGSTSYFDKIGGSQCQSCPTYAGFDMVVAASLDEYTMGIAEMPFSWGVAAPDALRTQAVAARSYATSFALSTDHRTMGCFCDVRNDSSYQVFAGWLGGWPENQRWESAARDTAGEVMTHPAAPDGPGVVRAYYSSSNGGKSEWVKDKWGSSLPYLLSINDPWSLTPSNPYRAWSSTHTADAVVDKIWGTTVNYTLTGSTVTARNASGSAKTVRFTAIDPSGQPVTKDVPVGTVTSKFGLLSWYFDVDISGLTTPAARKSDRAAVQDPRTGIWTMRGPNGESTSFYFGNPKDIPFIGDWNGNGVDTVGLYRESTGYLFLRQSNTQGIADIEIYFGNPGDLPVAGDWDGNGTDTVGVYRRSEGMFYLRNSNTQGVGDLSVEFGNPNDIPLSGDWDGDGIDSIGVYRPSTRMVYLINDISDTTPDIAYSYQGAAAGDRVIAGDWNDDGIDTVGVFRPSTATWYLRDTFSQSSANLAFEFGDTWMNPVAGYWGN